MIDRRIRLPRGQAAPAVLAFALLLTSATQLRLPGTPLGPGEALIGAFLGFALLVAARRGGLRRTELLGPWAAFWVIALAALALGWAIGLATGESTAPAARDALAYLLCATTVGVLITQARGSRFLVDTLGWLAVGSALTLGLMLAAGALTAGRIGPIQVWYHDVRFRGWAVNPNQLALLIAPLPWLALAIGATGWWNRAILGGSALVLAVAGIATRSDALLVAWAAAAVFVLAWVVLQRAAMPTRSLQLAAMQRVIIPLALLSVIVVVAPTGLAAVEERLYAAYDEGGQGSDRIARFGHGLDAVAESPVVGFGPGSFAGASAPFLGQEAHNSMIDWATSTGFLGLAALALLSLWVLVQCVRARSHGATMAVVVLLLFMSFHYVLRQPVAWFYLLAAGALADSLAKAPRGRIEKVT